MSSTAQTRNNNWNPTTDRRQKLQAIIRDLKHQLRHKEKEIQAKRQEYALNLQRKESDLVTERMIHSLVSGNPQFLQGVVNIKEESEIDKPLEIDNTHIWHSGDASRLHEKPAEKIDDIWPTQFHSASTLRKKRPLEFDKDTMDPQPCRKNQRLNDKIDFSKMQLPQFPLI